EALGAFRNGLSDPGQVLENWVTTEVDPCSWYHITCYGNRDQIVHDLGNSNLEGTLVPALANLKRLQYLELYLNKINGSIPIEFGNLAELVSLDLYNNSLTGTIPNELSKLTNLKYLCVRLF
ncbi:brassinosteroid insensitive 1-associated receptor kinase 1, partial [Phtheirospermum japonicum]